jgi:hypothetical protein
MIQHDHHIAIILIRILCRSGEKTQGKIHEVKRITPVQMIPVYPLLGCIPGYRWNKYYHDLNNSELSFAWREADDVVDRGPAQSDLE